MKKEIIRHGKTTMITLEPGMAEWMKAHSMNMSGFCRQAIGKYIADYENRTYGTS